MDANEVLFRENHAAAQSLKSAWTRLASTYGCMMVVLTRSTMTVRPHWFAKWLIMPFRLDLCHEIPVASIIRVSHAGMWCEHGKVELHYRTAGGKDRGMLLYLRNYRELLDKVSIATGRKPPGETSHG